MPGFMIQGGCPLGTGTGGTSILGQSFGVETSFNLRHFRGALAMAHAGGAIGSQFYIVQATSLSAEFITEFQMIRENLNEPFGVFGDGHRVYFRDFIVRGR